MTNYKGSQYGSNAIDTDHFTQYVDLKLNIKREKQKRIYIYNYKNKAGQEKFQQMTSQPGMFTKCFGYNISVEKQIEIWKNKLFFCIEM